LYPNLSFKTLQDLDIDLSVNAIHPPPIAGHGHSGETELGRARFDQQHSNAYEVSFHYVWDIPQHVELELLQIRHWNSDLELSAWIAKTDQLCLYS
jgi:hypothetical protein